MAVDVGVLRRLQPHLTWHLLTRDYVGEAAEVEPKRPKCQISSAQGSQDGVRGDPLVHAPIEEGVSGLRLVHARSVS